MPTPSMQREADMPRDNPLGLEGIEWVEYATRRPQALGHVLEMMGFRPVARHRSREVLLYRQGDMNVVVNGHDGGVRGASLLAPTEAVAAPALEADAPESPTLAALGLRVRDAAAAWERAVALGAWGLPTEVAVMELNIPAIHGVGASRIYFIDRWREFSIWSVDFVPIPTVDPRPSSLAGLHWFGVVQYIGAQRLADWLAFYRTLLGFEPLPDEARLGILPKGCILQSPCASFYLQLVEARRADADEDECLQRMALGAPDVATACRELAARGVRWQALSTGADAPSGALSETWLGSVMFELVQHHDRAPA